MTVRAFALVLGLIVLATGVPAAEIASRGADPTSTAEPWTTETVDADPPVGWVRSWLVEPLRRAIADATDTRPRK